MPENRDATEDTARSLFDKLETLEGRDTGDSLGDGGRRPPTGGRLPETPNHCERPVIPSSAKVVAYHLLNADTSTGERRLFALIDAVCCVLVHNNHYGQETARLALEAVAHAAVARKAIRILTADS